mgnify:CR=1 FL=1
MNFFKNLIFGLLFLFACKSAFSQVTYPGQNPGKAIATGSTRLITLENAVLKIVFQIDNTNIHPLLFTDKANNYTISLSNSKWFSLALKNGQLLNDANFHLAVKPVITSIIPDKKSAKLSDHYNGKIITATLIDPSSNLKIKWQARLTDGANYIQQRWAFHASSSLEIIKYAMLVIPSKNVIQDGTVDGSPLVSDQMFFALEHPMSRNEINTDDADSYLPMQNTLLSSDSLVITTVMGSTPPNQLRRGFLYYLERERAHPYRAYLHYNSWYDLSWSDRKMHEDSCFDRIRMYGDSLVKKRNVHLEAFLFDDGWDNDSTLWQVSRYFPGGFTKMHELANYYGANLGLWISPWGGYDPSQSLRLKYGREQRPPFETNANGFSLAGPVYYERFKEVTTRFMEKDGVSIFKFDGVGAGNGASGAGLAYQKDIEALLRLTRQLRAINQNLFLSLTVGTWPSPYWLYYGDATWRAGSDFGMTGEGSKRQRWITYRDAESYKNVVKRAPLYPLNSVMLHGINIAGLGYPAQLEMDLKDITDGIWSFFGSGTDLQELYVNPHLLTTPMWDCLASAANWSQKNQDVLQDVHWIGGDPGKGEVYGYAAWSPRKGIISLRNPSSKSQTFELDFQKVFELPAKAIENFRLINAINPKDNASVMSIEKDKKVTITLAPFELKLWNALPSEIKK